MDPLGIKGVRRNDTSLYFLVGINHPDILLPTMIVPPKLGGKKMQGKDDVHGILGSEVLAFVFKDDPANKHYS